MVDERTEKQKVKEITDKLEQGLKELFESEKYKSYLTTMSKFHNYSFNNTLLIAMQKPEATLVAGYRAWQKNFERHVNKGEKAIRILAPAPYKIKEERDKLDPVTGELMFDENGMPQKEEVEVSIPAFRAVSVFDVSQTEGKPIPELEAQELLSGVDGYTDFVQALTTVSPVPIGFEDIPGDSKGYFHMGEKRIAIQENMSESQTLKTMVHEVAHSMLHNQEVNQEDVSETAVKDRNTKEVEAESIAYTVCQHFGIDTSDYSFGYIAGWSSGKDMKELKSSLDTIRKTSSELITGIEGILQELRLNREVELGKDITLLVHNHDFSEYDLLHVRGMEKEELSDALFAMNEDDRMSVEAYLESKGAWAITIADERTEDVAEYHSDYEYNMDTQELIHTQGKSLSEEQEQKTEIEEKVELSAMKQAEVIIGHLEQEKTAFTNEERNLIVNYAFKTNDMEKTRKLAEHIYYQEAYGNQDVALAMIEAQAEIDALLDSMIGISEMVEYGYTWNEMLPLTQEKALELFDHDMPVYLLYQDGSESTAEDRKQIMEHDGIFGIEKGDWENERKLRSMLIKEEEQEHITSGQSVQKSEPEKIMVSESVIDDGDEIIDLGDEKETVLAEMRKTLENTDEKELAFRMADRYISIHEVEDGYDYSIMGADYKEIDGGVYDNPDVTIRKALTDIVEDLKNTPDHNGAKGNIQVADELILIDYDGLMEKVEEANSIVPQKKANSVIEDFRAKTNELFHEISEMNPSEIEETVKCHVQAKLDEYGIDATIVDAVVTGSRCRGLERENSDLDVVVELSTNDREDDLFHALNEDELHIGEVKVDINPITAKRTGTLETYLPQAEKYLESIREERQQEQLLQVQMQIEAEQKEVEVTLTVAECGEFHNYGEFYENIPTVEEAIAIWKQIPPERLNAIPSIGINIHRPEEEYEMDIQMDIVSRKRIDLEMLSYSPDISNEPKAVSIIAELIANLPEMEIDGIMSEEMEALVWEKRMSKLEPEKQLAVELDRFTFVYDEILYHDSTRSMTENVEELHELIKQGDIEPLTMWLGEVIATGTVPEEIEKVNELLEKLAAYKPLAKIEEMEEQNYNMIDNVLNNGVEKAQKQTAVRTSLKARLAEKKAQVAGHGEEGQENMKKSQRDI